MAKVQIKSWEELKKQFGETKGGYIPCKFYFTPNMRKYCGKVFEFEKLTDKGEVIFKNFSGDDPYVFSLDMIKFYEGKEKTFPSLYFEGDFYGKVGKITKYKDCYGRPLYVGDVVEIEERVYGLKFDQFVIENEYPFVMGLKNSCNYKDGKINDRYKISLLVPHNALKDGDKYGEVIFKVE